MIDFCWGWFVFIVGGAILGVVRGGTAVGNAARWIWRKVSGQ